MVGTTAGGTLSNLTLDGNLDLQTNNAATATITNGMNLKGDIFVGNSGGSTYGILSFSGNEDVGGIGNILFGANASNQIDYNAGQSTIEGMAINNFGGYGILVDGRGDTIAGNYIGTDASGATAEGNGGGIDVLASNNTIGGTTAADRNIISGNVIDGVDFFVSSTSGNLVEGNYIGTDATGEVALANGVTAPPSRPAATPSAARRQGPATSSMATPAVVCYSAVRAAISSPAITSAPMSAVAWHWPTALASPSMPAPAITPSAAPPPRRATSSRQQ